MSSFCDRSQVGWNACDSALFLRRRHFDSDASRELIRRNRKRSTLRKLRRLAQRQLKAASDNALHCEVFVQFFPAQCRTIQAQLNRL